MAYKNHETWNVALWINNDESMYLMALSCKNYAEYKTAMDEIGMKNTPDNVYWNDPKIDIDAIDEVIAEIL